MADTKKMDESAFAKLVKELNAVAELIRARQDEKQAVIKDFDSERNRFNSGKISKKTLISSIKKTNKEITRLDKDIRKAIDKSGKLSTQIRTFISKQSPKNMKVRLSKSKGGKRKKKIKKKVAKKEE